MSFSVFFFSLFPQAVLDLAVWDREDTPHWNNSIAVVRDQTVVLDQIRLKFVSCLDSWKRWHTALSLPLTSSLFVLKSEWTDQTCFSLTHHPHYSLTLPSCSAFVRTGRRFLNVSGVNISAICRFLALCSLISFSVVCSFQQGECECVRACAFACVGRKCGRLADERQPMHELEGGLACCHGNSAAYQNVLDIY